eukprot:51524-Rhodomonas_salina.1
MVDAESSSSAAATGQLREPDNATDTSAQPPGESVAAEGSKLQRDSAGEDSVNSPAASLRVQAPAIDYS